MTVDSCVCVCVGEREKKAGYPSKGYVGCYYSGEHDLLPTKLEDIVKWWFFNLMLNTLDQLNGGSYF